MNRFDEAVLELLSGAPRTTAIEGLRARVRRRRRRRFATVAVAIVIVGSAGVAAALDRHDGGTEVAVSPTTPSTAAATSPWCVAVSRAQAVTGGVAYGTVIVAAPSTRTKLVSLAELEKGSPFGTDSQTRLVQHDTFWVVELRPTSASQGPYTWGLVALDANTGDVVTGDEGQGAEPAYFGALPDHGFECGRDTTTTTTSTLPVTTPYVSPRVSVAVVFGTPTLASGKREPATLVIQNNTGAPIRSTACEIPGESVLGQVGLTSQPPPPPTTTSVSTPAGPIVNGGGPCLGPEHEMAGIGTTRVAFVLEASSSLCQLAPAAQLQVHECLPGGQPLAPGRYYVSFDWYGGSLPNPTIPVEVVASSS